MSRAEEFIKAKTRIGSNTTKGWRRNGVSIPSYSLPWLTPDQARKAVEIAREETIKEVCEWLEENVMKYHWYDPYEDNEGYNGKGLINDLKQAIKDK
jgi:hypothetical protein